MCQYGRTCLVDKEPSRAGLTMRSPHQLVDMWSSIFRIMKGGIGDYIPNAAQYLLKRNNRVNQCMLFLLFELQSSPNPDRNMILMSRSLISTDDPGLLLERILWFRCAV